MRVCVYYYCCYFSIAEKVESGTLQVKIKYVLGFSITVLDEKYDICDGAGFECPTVGQTEIKFIQEIEEGTPHVSYYNYLPTISSFIAFLCTMSLLYSYVLRATPFHNMELRKLCYNPAIIIITY